MNEERASIVSDKRYISYIMGRSNSDRNTQQHCKNTIPLYIYTYILGLVSIDPVVKDKIDREDSIFTNYWLINVNS